MPGMRLFMLFALFFRGLYGFVLFFHPFIFIWSFRKAQTKHFITVAFSSSMFWS